LEDELRAMCVNKDTSLFCRSILDIRGEIGVMKLEHNDSRAHF